MLGIDTIKELWGREVEDVEAEIASWDSVASEYLLEENDDVQNVYTNCAIDLDEYDE